MSRISEELAIIRDQLQNSVRSLPWVRKLIIDDAELLDEFRDKDIYRVISDYGYIEACKFYGKQRALLYGNPISDVMSFNISARPRTDCSFEYTTTTTFAFSIYDSNGNELVTPDLDRYYLTKDKVTNTLQTKQWAEAYSRPILDTDTDFEKVWFTVTDKVYGPSSELTLRIAHFSDVTKPKIFDEYPLRRNWYQITVNMVPKYFDEDSTYVIDDIINYMDQGFYKCIQDIISTPAPDPSSNPDYWVEVIAPTPSDMITYFNALSGVKPLSASVDSIMETLIITYDPGIITHTELLADLLSQFGYIPYQKSRLDISDTEPGEYTEYLEDDYVVIVVDDTYGTVIILAEGLRMNSGWDYLDDDPEYAMELTHTYFLTYIPDLLIVDDINNSSDIYRISSDLSPINNVWWPYPDVYYSGENPYYLNYTSRGIYNQTKWQYAVLSPAGTFVPAINYVRSWSSSHVTQIPSNPPAPYEQWVFSGHYVSMSYEEHSCTFNYLSSLVIASTSFVTNDSVSFVNEGGTLPSGLSYGTTYYVLSSGSSFQISTSPGGLAVTFTNNGSSPNAIRKSGASSYACYNNDAQTLRVSSNFSKVYWVISQLVSLGNYITLVPGADSQRILDQQFWTLVNTCKSTMDAWIDYHDSFNPISGFPVYNTSLVTTMQTALNNLVAVDRLSNINTIIGTVTTEDSYSYKIYQSCSMMTNMMVGVYRRLLLKILGEVNLMNSIRNQQLEYKFYDV